MVLYSDNYEDEGTYDVAIKVFLEKYPTIEKSTTFKVAIGPCFVSSFTPVEASISVDYILASGPLDVGDYDFVQDFACGYQVTKTISVAGGMPSFITHNYDDQNFSIETDNLSQSSPIEITVTGSITVSPTQTTSPITTNVLVTFNLINPCETTEFDSLVINNMFAVVKGDHQT